MLTLRSTSPFALVDRIEHQLSHQLHSAERVPAAEVHETAEAYVVVLELPGVDKEAIDVKATDRSMVIKAERCSQRPLSLPEPATEAAKSPLLSEFRYGTWNRGFRFPQAIAHDKLQARYQGGLLTVTAPKVQNATTVTVRVDG
jgi:HSP20 family protein